MLAEFGVFCLVLALLAACLPVLYALPNPALRQLSGSCLSSAAWVQTFCLTLALGVLICLRIDSDFTVMNVILHSNRSLPLLYKITGAWGNHEGSMLLWVWVLALFGALLAMPLPVFSASLSVPPVIEWRRRAVAVQSMAATGFLAFILFTSNPFERRFPPTTDGEALNPLLQDIALAIHPPLLYLGYVGFSIVFSLAIAFLWLSSGTQRQKTEELRQWAALAHPWILASWGCLTLGIGLGSWWAYRELGWGGFWFWDPVENASLLPWLSGTALLHANTVLKKRGLLKQWVLLLSIITFGLSLLGTFLVRSGVLISVHSFASDPQRGLYILAYITALIGGGLLLFALRARDSQPRGLIRPSSREGLIVINNTFLLTACATVLLGTLYPMLAEWLSGERLTVGPPFFNSTFLPLMALPLFFAGLAPFMAWKKASIAKVWKEAAPACLAALAAMLLALAYATPAKAAALLGMALAGWLGAASVQWAVQRRSRQMLGVFFAHLGAAFLVAGVTGAGLWKQEAERWMQPGETIEFAGYRLTYEERRNRETPNHTATQARFAVTDRHGRLVATLIPEHRRFSIRNSDTSEAAIYSAWGSDLYAVIGESSPDGARTAARFYHNPMIGLIWLGFVLMALGGFTAIIQQKVKRRAPEF